MVMDKLENKFEKSISTLSEKEQNFFRKVKVGWMSVYNNWIKPILIAIFLFWLFNKINTAVGFQATILIQLTIIIIYLRGLSSKLG